MPNPFFYLARKFLNKTAPKPINSAQYSIVGQELLNTLANLKQRVECLEQSREVQTHFAKDHETIEWHTKWIDHCEDVVMEGVFNRLSALEKNSREPYDFTELVKRIEHLEAAHISKKLREITSRTSKAKSKRKANGRMAGRHAST